jgi:predicted O-methyltransferase YrrM
MASLLNRIGFKLLMRSPVQSRHAEPSLLFFVEEDDPAKPSKELINLALNSITAAQQCDLSDITERFRTRPKYPEIWPGEHYKLLAGLVSVIKPAVVVEIGTATGSSALSLRKYLPANGRLVTFDVIPWRNVPGSCLQESDFHDGLLEQRLDDLSQDDGLRKNIDLLEAAELIFIDAAKDGFQEQRFLDAFETVHFKKSPILVFDDIRVWNMLKIWNGITRPKLDLTSFGHWSGTGLVQW